MKIFSLIILGLCFNIGFFSQQVKLHDFVESYEDSVSFNNIIDPSKRQRKKVKKNLLRKVIPDDIMENFICGNKGFCLFKNDTIKIQYYYGSYSDLSKNISVMTYIEVHSFNNQQTHLIIYNHKKKKITDRLLIKGFWEDNVFTQSKFIEESCFLVYTAYMLEKKESNVDNFFWAKVYRKNYTIDKKTGILTLGKATNNRELLIEPLKRGTFNFYEGVTP